MMFENINLSLLNVFAQSVLQEAPEGSRSWKYIHFFSVAKGTGKIHAMQWTVMLIHSSSGGWSIRVRGLVRYGHHMVATALDKVYLPNQNMSKQ